MSRDRVRNILVNTRPVDTSSCEELAFGCSLVPFVELLQIIPPHGSGDERTFPLQYYPVVDAELIAVGPETP